MIKTLMLIWATATDADGSIVASGMTSMLVTQEECALVKSKVSEQVDVLCLTVGSPPKAKPVAKPAIAKAPIPVQKPKKKSLKQKEG